MNGLVDANGKPLLFNSVQAAGPDKVFAVAQDNTVWEHFQTSPSTAMNTHLAASILAKQISATETQSGADEVFITGINDTLYEYSTGVMGDPYHQLLAGGVAATSTPQ